MSRGTEAIIDLAALNHNFNRVRAIAREQKILAMVKSNAYGHGLIRVANALAQVDSFGVATLGEAMQLREAGINKDIVLMVGFISAEELSACVTHGFSVVIHHSYQLEILEQNNFSKELCVWLKVDTGMHRLGFAPHEVSQVLSRLNALKNIEKPIRLMTHLADADNSDRAFTQQQLKTFFATTRDLALPKSVANSAGILAYPEALMDWVRPGLMLYGISPLPGRSAEEEGLLPVMTLVSQIIAIKHLKRGDFVGYGCAWRCPEDMPVGIVAIGYGDGYPRHASSGTPTLVCNKVCPLVGRVSMDLLAIDLRAYPQAFIGDIVTLWGKGLPVEVVANFSNSIPYELLTGLTQRVASLTV